MAIIVKGGGGKPEEEKTVTAGTSVIEVLPGSGKVIKKVTVNPTPTEEKTITAGTYATTVTPTSGKYIKKVTVNPTPSQSKTVTPSTSQQTVSPDSGKLLSQVIVKAMEDVTTEVTAQTPVITQIAENLGVTITTPSGTNKQILQGNNANLLNIKNNAKKEGAYVWKKLTAEGGDFIDFVVSDSETAYPDGAVHTDGYWYEKINPLEGLLEATGYTKMAVDKITPSSALTFDNKKVLSINHSLGENPKLYLLLSDVSRAAVYNHVGIIIGDGNTYQYKLYGDGSPAWSNMNEVSSSCDANAIKLGTGRSYTTFYLTAGVEYTLITMA